MPGIQCNSCGVFFTAPGYSNHLIQTTKPECVAIYEAEQAQLLGSPDSSDGGPPDAEEAMPPLFEGNFFGLDYGPDDFGYDDAEPHNIAGEPWGHASDSELEADDGFDDEHGWELPLPLSPSPEPDNGYETPPHPLSSSPEPDHNNDPPPPADADQHGCLLSQAERQHVADQIWQQALVDVFPGGGAGRPLTVAQLSSYDDFRDHWDHNAPGNVWAPFHSQLEWEFARWAELRGPTSTAVMELLSIHGISERLALSFKNSHELNQLVDEHLPSRPAFHRKELVIDGQSFDVYFRDIIQCIRALYSNPQFQPYLVFTPECHYRDGTRAQRVYHDMHTGDWWWSTQEAIEAERPGATIIPILISSDKTLLTLFRNKSAYPVYLTIGNIPKEICRKPSRGAQILLGYLPTSRLEHIDNKAARRRALANMFHACMCRILDPIRGPGVEGVQMASGDGVVRRCHPIMVCFIGDYPEQMLVICGKSGQCYGCALTPDQLGNNRLYDLHDLDAVLDALDLADGSSTDYTCACVATGIKPVYHPFWEALPYVNIFKSITSDVLHQLYQGVVKHLMSWLRAAFGDAEIDARCRCMLRNHNLHHFAKGITTLSKITGTEHKDMCRIILGLIVDLHLPNNLSPSRLLRCVCGLLDFVYLAQYPSHTTNTLDYMQRSLNLFHANKDIFVQLNIRQHFNIPKVHTLQHYRLSIEMFGTMDNYDTSYTERLHIDMAKDAYRASDKKDEYSQMTLWLSRKEKIQQHVLFIEWRLSGHPSLWTIQPAGVLRHMHLKMAKTPSTYGVSFATLANDYGAVNFVQALSRFIVASCHPMFSPARIRMEADALFLPFGTMSAYFRLKFWNADPQGQDAVDTLDSVHVKPECVSAQGRTIGGRFDTVFIELDGHRQGAQAFRVAQICAIFSLPASASSVYTANVTPPRYMAYVEWFSAFTTPPSPKHGMYGITRSYLNGKRVASIVLIARIFCSAHLFPHFGPVAPRDWTSSDVLEQCSTFYVNPLVDRHTHIMIH